MKINDKGSLPDNFSKYLSWQDKVSYQVKFLDQFLTENPHHLELVMIVLSSLIIMYSMSKDSTSETQSKGANKIWHWKFNGTKEFTIVLFTLLHTYL